MIISDDNRFEANEVFTVVARNIQSFGIQNDTVTITVEDDDRTFSEGSFIHAGAKLF